MTRTHSVTVGDLGSFRARDGETILEAALLNGLPFPHDCQSGHCGACRCNLVAGDVDSGHTDAPGSILACQARIASDITIELEQTPAPDNLSGRVKSIRNLCPDVVELEIVTPRPLQYLPGQYCQFRFAGFPTRCYSPTLPLEGPADRGTIRLQIRRVRNGCISAALGESIAIGHKVKVTGPFGSAYLRPGKRNRLILVSGGTGFAPIWSIAHAALCEMPDREITVVAAANDRQSLYMAPALMRLLAFHKVQIAPVIRNSDRPGSVLRVGDPVAFLPQLRPDDLVYAAGSPTMVEKVAAKSRDAGAVCYIDPFASSHSQESDLLAWARKMLTPPSPFIILRRFEKIRYRSPSPRGRPEMAAHGPKPTNDERFATSVAAEALVDFSARDRALRVMGASLISWDR